jgi:aldehyde:ferredoxin oxidoreductase
MECFEKGIITREMTYGQELKFGDIDSFKWLAEKIATLRGIGGVLAKGTREAAEIFGGGSEKFAIQIKGLEQSGYGTRNAPAMMLAYMTCDVGAHHNRAWAITWDIQKGRDLLKGKAKRVIYLQHVRPMFDMLGVCRLQWVELGLGLEHYPEILKRVTGFDYTLPDLLKISERVWNLTRAFWKKENPEFGRKNDQPPARFLEEEIPTGPSKGKKMTQEKIDKLLNDYYKQRGWNKNGIPTKRTLRKLGLDFVIEDIYPKKKGK